MKRVLITIAVLMIGTLLAFQVVTPAQTALVQPADFQYLGAFRLQNSTSTASYATLDYSNGAIGFSPTGNGGAGSILVTGHTYRGMVAEFEIPTPVISKNLSTLPVARMIRPFTDVAAAASYKAPSNSMGPFPIGMAWVPSLGRMVFAYDDDYTVMSCEVGSYGTLGTFLPTLTGTQGLWNLSVGGAAMPQFQTSRYVVALPTDWAAANVGGALVASGRHRNWCAMGPNLFAWTPAGQPAATAIPGKTLMLFGPEGDTAHQSKEFSMADTPNGAVWLKTPDGRQAYAVSGVKDWDPANVYYGYENWVRPSQCEPTNTCKGWRGERAGDARGTLLLYNPDDLAAVAKGTKTSWSVAWYAKYDFTPYMLSTYGPTFLTSGYGESLFSSSFDPATGRLYVSENFTDGGLRPIIHVFQVGTGGTTPPPPTDPPPPTVTAPSAPTNAAVAADSASVTVTWADNASNETAYALDRSPDGATFSRLMNLGSNTVRYVDSAVTAGQQYCYRVSASNSAGTSAFSNVACATVPAPPPPPATTPAAPTNATATAQGTAVAVAWSDNASTETGYTLDRSVNGDAFARLASLGTNVTRHTDTAVTAGLRYCYRVSAVNGSGASPYSNAPCATPSTAQTAGGTVDFDNPAPPGTPGSWLATFGGIDWGSMQWKWAGAEVGVDPTNHARLGSTYARASFRFPAGAKMLQSIALVASKNVLVWIRDNNGQGRFATLIAGRTTQVTLGWWRASSAVSLFSQDIASVGITAVTFK
jgi:hypothetical protein